MADEITFDKYLKSQVVRQREFLEAKSDKYIRRVERLGYHTLTWQSAFGAPDDMGVRRADENSPYWTVYVYRF